MNEQLIYQKKCSIPDKLCSDIILMYELENIKNAGLTLGGVQKQIKNTIDMVIPKQDIKWSKIEAFLYKELSIGLKEYLTHLNVTNYNKDKNGVGIEYKLFESGQLQVDAFMIQKYDKQVGKYVYHNDFYAEHELKSFRVITYLWYLNNVEEGGETEFWGGKFNVKPETGKLLLFPASWTFPHRGKVPISDNKYIITGWFYIKEFD